MPETDDEVAAAVRGKHDQAVIEYLEAIRNEIHALPGRILGGLVLLAVAGAVLIWLVGQL